ncbi:hypothetical protein SH1V18_46350 [Vallitalea longa]|uniref:ABC3 transporter permease C-terminal domain-containing protein n=1 Tax=Vallitalea longa TaxID=2936439 RepID=A0A9W5YDM0_9FIRM|nr:ABC transporter permease [Vallitalea longa]GKX32155.1 hypothetical protein SH1V18_46350 [Vallitalea longa]
MGFKLFSNVLFENKKILVTFILLLILTLTFISIRIISLTNDLEENSMPDIIVKGKMDEDGKLRYKYYNDMPTVSRQLTESLDDDIKVYGITTRSMATMKDSLTNSKIEYTIYGVDKRFMEEKLSHKISQGGLPQSEELEAVMGSYARNFYKVNVDERINHPITLNTDWIEKDINNYTLSGVLDENMKFFKGGIFLSRDTYEKLYNKVEENLVFIYVNGEKDYNNALDMIYQLKRKDNNIGDVIMNFHYKVMARRKATISCILIGIVALVLVLVMIAYLMKGLTKKIGILKSLGISNQYILAVFIGGLCLTYFISYLLSIVFTYVITILLNINMSNFLGYQVKEYEMNNYSLLVGILFVLACSLVSYINIYRYNSKISPKKAMMKD